MQSDYISLPATCWFSPRFHTTDSNIRESDGLQWLWMCITRLIVFNIIFLWGLFFLLFCLLAELIPFLSQHVGEVASNRLTNTDHRQAGGKSLPTPTAALSLKQHFTNAQFELITWQSAGRSSKSLLGQRLDRVSAHLRTVKLSERSENGVSITWNYSTSNRTKTCLGLKRVSKHCLDITLTHLLHM